MNFDNTDRPPLEVLIHRLYTATIGRTSLTRLTKQRLKLLWYAPGYWPILTFSNLSIIQKITILFRFLRIDWNVVHGHTPYECALVCRDLTAQLAHTNDTMIEAGCWEGGSSAKWSIICRMMGLDLVVFDSFEGVEVAASPVGEYDYSGTYAAQQEVVVGNIGKYGEPAVCRTVKGWFSETMAAGNVAGPVRAAYIDCDTAKGTKEALTGILPVLLPDGLIFSQDCHIPSVLRYLKNPNSWNELHSPMPKLERLERRLVRLSFP